MPELVTTERLQQALSVSMEERATGYVDLVSNANIIWYEMKQAKMMQPYVGPRIREHLVYSQTGTFKRYSGADYLMPTRTQIVNDAEYVPQSFAVNVTLTNDDILDNGGAAQVLPLMATYMEVAEGELVDRFVEDLHSNGSAKNQIGGLQLAIPTDPTSGTYGGIDRSAVALWRTKKFDVDSDIDAGTQITSSTVQAAFLQAVIATSRNKRGANMLVSSTEHYQAYAAATTAIQRINDDNELGGLGFTALKFYGAGRSIRIVLEGGIGTAMPSNVTYGIDSKGLKYRYCPERHFVPFGGEMMPVNQDIVVRHIGSRGQVTMTNPLHQFKMFDSDLAS